MSKSGNFNLNRYLQKVRGSNSDVIARRVLDAKIDQNTKELQILSGLIKQRNGKVARDQREKAIGRAKQLAADLDYVDSAIKLHKKEIEHLRSQILRVDNEIAKYSIFNNRTNAENVIKTLESRLFDNNDKKDSLKLKANQSKTALIDLLLRHQEFQAARNDMLAQLMANKREISDLTNCYTISIPNNGRKHGNDSKQTLKEQQRSIGAAKSNHKLVDSKTLQSEKSFQEQDSLTNQLTQIKEHAPNMTLKSFNCQRRQTFYPDQKIFVENIKVTTVQEETSSSSR